MPQKRYFRLEGSGNNVLADHFHLSAQENPETIVDNVKYLLNFVLLLSETPLIMCSSYLILW